MFFLSLWFIFMMESTTTLVFEFVRKPKLDNDTTLLGALIVVSVLSNSLCLLLLGKEHLHFGIGFEQWGRFHKLYSALGKRSEF